MANTPKRSVRIPDDLWTRIEEIAAANDRTPSYVIVDALREFVERHGADN